MKCPKCAETKGIITECRLDGDSECVRCRYKASTKEFYQWTKQEQGITLCKHGSNDPLYCRRCNSSQYEAGYQAHAKKIAPVMKEVKKLLTDIALDSEEESRETWESETAVEALKLLEEIGK